MAKISRNILILGCIISCAITAAGPLAGSTTEQIKKVDLTKDPTILVEAFVVEVSLSALNDLGVSPIGEKPNSVSIENILHCLQDENNAKIDSGAKVASKQRQRGNIELEETIYIEQERPIKTDEKSGPVISKNFRPYKIGKSFEAIANIIDHQRISISYDFRQEEAAKVSQKNEAPPTIVKRLWAGTVCLETGKASIVGATQDEKKAVFLILCADIKGN